MKSIATIFMMLLLLIAYGTAKPSLDNIHEEFQAPSDERSHGVNDLAKKVVGGSFTIQYQWPWQADILRNGLHHCGGTLIYDQWVLTAAHCLTEDKSVYTVRLGEYNRAINEGTEKDITIEEIINHKDHIPHPMGEYNDIALIKLSRKVEIHTRAITTINLPRTCCPIQPNDLCYILGWGNVDPAGPTSTILKTVDQPVISNADCLREVATIVSSKICAGYKDRAIGACAGDSGGPLQCFDHGTQKWYLQGVISQSNCINDFISNAYTIASRVSSYLPWVKEKTGN